MAGLRSREVPALVVFPSTDWDLLRVDERNQEEVRLWQCNSACERS